MRMSNFFFEKIVKHLNKLKNIGDEHIKVFYTSVKICDEMTFVLLCVRKTKSVAKMRFKNIFSDH